ncbi:YfiH family protein [Salibacterium salarium]|uniref:peptidoglycan editing factor PgeF n=1 Tax=Salibacterium salarium TaxID=284579 RepID=UPI0027834FF0|nr:peptidoglycan editing factor PgeF [Salibacterium salarium]MDQ0299054.1 YfiH family protein [Salibacterium salarium]
MKNDPFLRQEESHFLLKEAPFGENVHVTAGMTTRLNGIGNAPYDTLNMAFHVGDESDAVLANRERVAKAIGFPLSDWVAAEQVHKADIVKVSNQDKGKGAWKREESVGNFDGMYTSEKGVLLVSFYADCVPLIFFAPKQEYVGVAHAGWKGTSLNIGGALVTEWIEKEGINSEGIYVAIGPSISEEVYEVDGHVIEQMEQVLPEENNPPWTKSRPNHWLLDVKEMNRILLNSAGVPLSNIFKSSHCTYSEPETFFSHRQSNGTTGRMMAFIGINDR